MWLPGWPWREGEGGRRERVKWVVFFIIKMCGEIISIRLDGWVRLCFLERKGEKGF